MEAARLNVCPESPEEGGRIGLNDESIEKVQVMTLLTILTFALLPRVTPVTPSMLSLPSFHAMLIPVAPLEQKNTRSEPIRSSDDIPTEMYSPAPISFPCRSN